MQDEEQQGEVHHREVDPVHLRPYLILNRYVNAEDPERLNEQVQEDKKEQI